MNIHPIGGFISNSQATSLSKALTWRVIAALVTGTVVYVFTGELRQTGEIVVVAEIILTIVYYLHERLWIKFTGR